MVSADDEGVSTCCDPYLEDGEYCHPCLNDRFLSSSVIFKSFIGLLPVARQQEPSPGAPDLAHKSCGCYSLENDAIAGGY